MMTNNATFAVDLARAGSYMFGLAEKLYPICRSITGNGVRDTLKVLRQEVPLEIHEVPTGTQVFDWQVPKEWNIREAWIKDSAGNKIVDFAEHNLHVVGYSIPVHETMSLEELRPHLHSNSSSPEAIPYRTSYYSETWGFCLPHKQLEVLPDGDYEVCIDSSLEDGSLTYGELLLTGESKEEFLFSTHVCHPSLANDNLTGIVLATELAGVLAGCQRHYSYRFLFIPATIGAITWLARNHDRLHRIRNGMVLAGCGDTGPLTYKRSRQGTAEIDRAAAHVLSMCDEDADLIDYKPYGYDERQFGSPGINLPVGRFSRTPFGDYPEYHSSADNLDFISPDALSGALEKCLKILEIIETNRSYRNLAPYGEPQLGRRGLYQSLGGVGDESDLKMALLWVLNLSDGGASLLEIADRSGIDYRTIRRASALLIRHELLEELTPSD